MREPVYGVMGVCGFRDPTDTEQVGMESRMTFGLAAPHEGSLPMVAKVGDHLQRMHVAPRSLIGMLARIRSRLSWSPRDQLDCRLGSQARLDVNLTHAHSSNDVIDVMATLHCLDLTVCVVPLTSLPFYQQMHCIINGDQRSSRYNVVCVASTMSMIDNNTRWSSTK